MLATAVDAKYVRHPKKDAMSLNYGLFLNQDSDWH